VIFSAASTSVWRWAMVEIPAMGAAVRMLMLCRWMRRKSASADSGDKSLPLIFRRWRQTMEHRCNLDLRLQHPKPSFDVGQRLVTAHHLARCQILNIGPQQQFAIHRLGACQGWPPIWHPFVEDTGVPTEVFFVSCLAEGARLRAIKWTAASDGVAPDMTQRSADLMHLRGGLNP